MWGIFFWPYLLPFPGRVTFPAGDFTYQFFIYRDIAYRALAVGHWPGWADCIFAGYPFQADPQSQLFYPPIWIIFGLLKLMGWGNFPLFALTLETLFHYFAASILLFFFLRVELADLGLPNSDSNSNALSLAALLGSITFTYGGYLIGYPPLQTAILETVTWLPLILLCLRKLATATHTAWRWTALTALALALAFFAGHPQTFLFVAYLSLAYGVYQARLRQRPWRWTLFYVAVPFALVLGLSLVQLLPEAQYLSLSNRSVITFEELASGFPPGIIFQLFITDPVWSPLYIGIVPLVLALLAVIGIRKGSVYFWLSCAILGFLLSLGGNTPLYTVAYWLLPGYRLFRGQERLALVVSFSLTVLAAYGVYWLFAVPRPSTRRAVQWTGGAFVALVFLVLWVTYNPTQANWWPRVYLLIGTTAVTIIAFAIYQFSSPTLTLTPAFLLIAGTVLNLWLARTNTNLVLNFDPYRYNPILDPIRADPDPFFRVQDDARMQGHFACGYGLMEWAGISPIRPAAWVAFDNQAPESLRWKLIGMKYLITWKNGAITRENELPPAERVAEGPAPLGDAKVYRMFEIPRRAWLVYDYHTETDSAPVFQQIGVSDFDPFKQAVLLAGSAPSLAGHAEHADNSVVVTEDWPGHLSLQISSNQPGLLLISEAYYPGWVASVNGQTTPVYEADGFFQALQVPAGQFTVIVDFQPMPFTLGAIGSLLALLVCLALMAPFFNSNLNSNSPNLKSAV